MEDSNLLREKLLQEYKPDIEKLSKYIPYFQSKGAKDVMNQYEADQNASGSLVFPIYDSNLMSFIKEAKKTKLINSNYVYVYSRKRMRTVKDEIVEIDHVTLKDFDVLTAILSKYVLKGMIKASLWTEAVEYKVFLKILLKMKELVDFWDKEEHKTSAY